MPENDGLMRIFWPIDIPRSDLAGVVVGWRNSKLDVFVVAVLEAVDVSVHRTYNLRCFTEKHSRHGTSRAR